MLTAQWELPDDEYRYTSWRYSWSVAEDVENHIVLYASNGRVKAGTGKSYMLMFDKPPFTPKKHKFKAFRNDDALEFAKQYISKNWIKDYNQTA